MSERIQGFFKARGVAGSDQHGNASTGSDQIAVDLDVRISDTETRRMTTVLSFGGKASPYSIERLVALGWDMSDAIPMRGLDTNEVDVEIRWERSPSTGEEYQRVEIKTASNRFAFKAPMTDQQKRGFMSRLAVEAQRQVAATAGGDTSFPPPASALANGGQRPKL